MAYIKAFSALRYSNKAGDIKDLCCPPYDIISESERLNFIETNPHNIIRLELPKGDKPYDEAKTILNDWIEQEILVRDMDEAIYVYEEEFKTQVTTGETKKIKGIICRVRVEDFSKGIVLPHENTLSKAKTDRLNLVTATECNFSQIYSMYIDEEHTTRSRIDNFTASQEPRYCFDDGLVIHRLWVINDKALISAICEDFAPRKLYIADGHHRYETSINYRNYCKENGIYSPGSEYVMMMLADMADEGLVVHPIHRMIVDLQNFEPDTLLEKCADYFDIYEMENVLECDKELQKQYDENKKAFCFYYGGNRYKMLVLKNLDVMNEIFPEASLAFKTLDVNVLHSLVLERLLGIDKENMANQINLRYTRSFEEAVTSVQNGEINCAFIVNPTRVSEIGEVSAAGEKMPQKSTYFYPKLITGLVINQLNP